MIRLATRTPRRVVARTVLFGTSALLVAGLVTFTPSAVSGWNQGAAEGTLWQLLNGARVNNGMAPLQQQGTLIGLARWRSQDMLNRNYFSHTIPGCGCAVYAYYDSHGVNYVWGGENIGWNSGLGDGDSPVAVHNAFMNSAGHRANVLNRSFTHGGVGGAAADNQQFLGYVQNTRMYTELFMQAPGAAAPAPAPAAPAPAPAARATAPTQNRTAPAGRAAAPAAPAAAAAAEPTAMEVAVAAPRRPESASVDGTSRLVSRIRVDLAARLMIDERSAVRAAALEPATAAGDRASDTETAGTPSGEALRVETPETVEDNLFATVFGALGRLISG